MPTAAPDPAEDRLREMVDALGLEPDTSITSVAVLTDPELSLRFSRVTQELLERGEALEPRTETGRDLHRELDAYRYELAKRRMR